jgi:hypothetical protein
MFALLGGAPCHFPGAWRRWRISWVCLSSFWPERFWGCGHGSSDRCGDNLLDRRVGRSSLRGVLLGCAFSVFAGRLLGLNPRRGHILRFALRLLRTLPQAFREGIELMTGAFFGASLRDARKHRLLRGAFLEEVYLVTTHTENAGGARGIGSERCWCTASTRKNADDRSLDRRSAFGPAPPARDGAFFSPPGSGRNCSVSPPSRSRRPFWCSSGNHLNRRCRAGGASWPSPCSFWGGGLFSYWPSFWNGGGANDASWRSVSLRRVGSPLLGGLSRCSRRNPWW